MGLMVGGVGLWALPTDTPIIGRPPIAIGGMLVIYGVLLVILTVMHHFGIELQSPFRRRVSKQSPQPPISPLLIPAPPSGPVKEFTDITISQIRQFEDTPNLTRAQLKAVLAPYIGKYMTVQGTVSNVDTGGITQLILASDGTHVQAYFDGEPVPVTSLVKGSTVKVVGQFKDVVGNSVSLMHCELV
jgi:hypothetical protein